MHVVVIHGWKEETPELVQMLAAALGVMVFEARQRMIGGGPSVVASFADPQHAMALADKLRQGGIAALVLDATAVRSRTGFFIVRRFVPGTYALHIEKSDGIAAEIPYEDMELLLPCTSVTSHTETTTVVERKFSIGKTVLSGGIPMKTKVERQEEVTSEETRKVLYLYADNRPPILFGQDNLTYDGFGSAMKLSRELNFAYLISELRRLSPGAMYDDRLLNRAGQVRTLGPVQNMGTNLDLAAEILARTLRHGRGSG
ncbi:hypothetical protein [Geobacter sp. AOG1]|uniref:hypothetical protein n=1 Tax=Geobacter sp. AOG1 TaxID=1566346 RepID=UPI001CC38E9F|nr:hypothetical protein [Geobacter sp. AOG1]GFE56258.1 hypothetical protein AOG1_01360 [Geobacter sp. AOG1]